MSTSRRLSGRGVRVLALAGVYVIVGLFGLAIAPVHLFASLVWPPTGIALATLLLGGTGLWPGVLLGAFVVNAWTGAPLLAAAAMSVGNTLEALVGAHLIGRVGERPWALDRVRSVLAFVVLGALLSTAISATVGVASLLSAGLVARGDVVETWRVWWLGDAVGALVVGALLLAWRGAAARRPLDRGRRAEALLLGASVSGAALLVFLHAPVAAAAGFVQACLLIPLLMWAALRFELRGATAAVFLASGIAIAGTAFGRGPFVQESLPDSLLYLQAFMATVAAAVLIVGAVTAERTEAMRRCEIGDAEARSLAQFPEQNPSPVLRASTDGAVLYANRPAAELLRALGSREGRLPPALLEALRRVPRAGTIRDVEVSSPPDRVHVFVLSRGAGEDHVNLFGLDITERKRAEEALREASRRKSEFLGVLSHELRNPLAPIRNALHLLRRGPEDPARAARALAVIERQTGQLTRLVDDLLDVTRISQGKIQLRRQRVELADLVRHAVEDHRPELEGRRIALAARIGAGPLWIDADAARVTQIIGNLLHNSAKFTNPGGHVTVSVERAGDGHAAIRVSDDGIGIDPEVLPRIFEPFTQADQSLDRSLGGLGLGLALVKALAEMHGGRVDAASVGLGRGAEFTVSLPLVAGAGDARDAAAGSAPVPAARRRVLVIEDNLDAADTLREALAMSGHEVAVAHDGEDGLAKVRAFEPEVVICDIGLPGLSGYEVARRIRAARGRAPTLIALTGYALPQDQAMALEAGFDHHLAKPIELATLQKVLARASRPAG